MIAGPRTSWSAMARPIPTGSPWTCSPRPNTTKTPSRSWSVRTRRSGSRRGQHRSPAADHGARRDHPHLPWRGRGALIQVADQAQACVANRIAPEHLELSVADPESWLPEIRHAGAIFTGRYTAEALGDYCAGPNHVLPTSGTARFSPLGVYDFQKLLVVSTAPLRALRPEPQFPLRCWLRGESLTAHAQRRIPHPDERGLSYHVLESFVKDLVPYAPGEQPKLSRLVAEHQREPLYGVRRAPQASPRCRRNSTMTCACIPIPTASG